MAQLSPSPARSECSVRMLSLPSQRQRGAPSSQAVGSAPTGHEQGRGTPWQGGWRRWSVWSGLCGERSWRKTSQSFSHSRISLHFPKPSADSRKAARPDASHLGMARPYLLWPSSFVTHSRPSLCLL